MRLYTIVHYSCALFLYFNVLQSTFLIFALFPVCSLLCWLFSCWALFVVHYLPVTFLSCCAFVMLYYFHVALFLCCILPCCSFFVLRFFQAALISCYILSLFYFCIHAALFLSCVLFTWRISLLAHNSYFIFLYVVLFQTALFSCLHSFHVAVFEVASCCICFHQGRLNKKEI